MANLAQKRCEHAGCSEAPHFNFDGGKGGRFYAQHKLEGMVCLAHKRHGPVIQTQTYRVILKLPLGLEFEDQNPPVGLPGVYVKSVREGLSAALSGEVRPGDRLIAVSASPGGSKEMVGCATVRDVISAFNKVKANQSVLLQLEHRRAPDETYSPPPEKGGIRGSRKRIPSCLQKRRHDLCLQQGCQKVKSFGWRKDEANGGGGQRKFCSQHKMAGMVNLRQPPTRRKTCEHHGCPVEPSFGVESENTIRFCHTHKGVGMVNIQLLRRKRKQKMISPPLQSPVQHSVVQKRTFNGTVAPPRSFVDKGNAYAQLYQMVETKVLKENRAVPISKCRGLLVDAMEQGDKRLPTSTIVERLKHQFVGGSIKFHTFNNFFGGTVVFPAHLFIDECLQQAVSLGMALHKERQELKDRRRK
uniref:PDZ domain-containing protein n=2 Tax=Heterosigma akashiwo TaxID=2829 RepID=A0A7S3Y0P4_HETAK